MARTVQELIDRAATRGGQYQPAAEEAGLLKEHVRRNPPDDATTARIEQLFPALYAEAVAETAERWLTSHNGWHAYRAEQEADQEAGDDEPDTDPGNDREDGMPAPPVADAREGMTLAEALGIAADVDAARRARRWRVALALLEVALMLLGVYGLLDLLDVVPET